MKRNLLLIATIFLMATRTLATTFMINVGGTSFTPSSITVHPGDVIMWMWTDGSHTTTSTSVPTGATMWDKPINSTATTFSYTPTVLGTYQYQCTFHVSMGMVGTITVVSAAEVPVTNPAPVFTMFPNPASTQAHLQFSNSGLPTFVTVTDITGKQVMRTQYIGTDQADLSLQNVPNGTYIIQAEQGTQVYKQQLVVSH